MGFIISVCSGRFLQEYTLPAVNNADHCVVLYRTMFKTRTDISLCFEVIDNIWRLCPAGNYGIYVRGEPCGPLQLRDGEKISIVTLADDRLLVRVRKDPFPLHPYTLYDICGADRINIGGIKASEVHFSMACQGERWLLHGFGGNRLYLNGNLVTDTAGLTFGDCIYAAGMRLVFLGRVLAADGHGTEITLPVYRSTRPDEKAAGSKKSPEPGKVFFHRAPRIVEKDEGGRVEIEAPPPPAEQGGQPLALTVGPAFTMALPMLLGCLLMVYASGTSGAQTGFFMYAGLVMSISSAVISVFWAAAGIRARRKDERTREKKRTAAYEAYLAEKETQIRDSYRRAGAKLRALYPEAAVLAGYDQNTPLLWNRGMQHEDFLCCRLGTGRQPFNMEISVPQKKFMVTPDELAERPRRIRDKYSMLEDVPVLADLVRCPLTGVVGGAGKEGAFDVAVLLLVQIAAAHCYTDVKIAFLYDGLCSENMNRWDFVRFLPHVWSPDRKMRYLAADRESIDEVCCELARIFRGRYEEAVDGEDRKGAAAAPYFVLFVTDPSLIENTMIEKYVYGKEPAYGLSVLVFADAFEKLPNACGYIIRNDSVFRGMYSVRDKCEERRGIVFDYLRKADVSGFARRLSGIEVPLAETGQELPEALTFLEMYGISRPEELNILQRWKKNRTYDSLRGMIGIRKDGSPCFLDMHEKYHGPHGLVAGTTGSGKSETLQTYILSLAVNYSPEDAGFFIIDYKGGGMAHLFDSLPHMLGQITNLSGNQIRRALVSIKSENRRRQQLFNENGVNNINDYTRLAMNHEDAEKLPHLFIIVDEFAELKSEQPDFMRDMISVAQVGRSLGVHLILATQKPGGTVDENIRSNSRFRLCLRVQTKEDSMDVLHKPDAYNVTQAGRGYLQVGNDEVYSLFQTGWSGALLQAKETGDRACLLTAAGRIDRVCAGSKDKEKEHAGFMGQHMETAVTELDAVIACIAKAAEQGGYASGKALWFPALPCELYLEELADYTDCSIKKGGWAGTCGELPETVVGLFDDPENQARPPLKLSFEVCGHVAVTGAVLSGKSTFLQTLLYALMTQYSPEQAIVYGIDYSQGALSTFEKAPHTGGIVTENNAGRLDSLFCLLCSLLTERKRLLQGGSFVQYKKSAGPGNSHFLPLVLLVIDGFPAFNEKTSEKYMKQLITLSKEGAGNGICLVISAGRFGINELPGRIAENMRTVISLELPDRYAYTEVLRVPRIDVLPESGVKGRGLAVFDDRVLEFQTALSMKAEDDYRRAGEIAIKCEAMSRIWQGQRALQIPVIPHRALWPQFAALPQVKAAAEDARWLPVGYDRRSAGVYSIDLRRTCCYLITGRAHSGKKNVMKAALCAARMKSGAEIAVIDTGDALPAVPETTDIRFVRTAGELYDFCGSFLVPLFKTRNQTKREAELNGASEEELFETAVKEFPVFVFIPDLPAFIRIFCSGAGGMDQLMQNLISRGRYLNIYFFGILPQEKKGEAAGQRVFEEFVSWRNGIRFGGETASETFLNFEYLSYAEQTALQKPGIGQIPDAAGEEDIRQVIIPLVKWGRNIMH